MDNKEDESIFNRAIVDNSHLSYKYASATSSPSISSLRIYSTSAVYPSAISADYFLSSYKQS